MADRSKERAADALMGELLVLLSQRESIKKMLGEIEEQAPGSLLPELVEEFEKIVDRRHLESILLRRDAAIKAGQTTANDIPAPPDAPSSVPSSAPGDVPGVAPGVVAPLQTGGPASNEDVSSALARHLEELLRKTRAASQPESVPDGVSPASAASDSPPPGELDLPGAPQVSTDLPDMKKSHSKGPARSGGPGPHGEGSIDREGSQERSFATPESVPAPLNHDHPASVPRPPQPRVPYEFADDDYVYMHAVAQIPPGEKESPKPFMLEEKGIGSKEFAFGYDYSGMRFYLSKINQDSMNVSRTGMLLLNKQDSIRLRAVHESILNDLRVHGVLLPFDFGTVALGKDRLLDKIDENLSELQTALEVLQGTSVWTLSVFVLDARIAQFVGPEGMTVRREPEKNRQSYHPPAQIGKIDIKVLERILGKEKKIAEAMHEEMRQAAERAEVNLMVGLGSGSSDDWKLILKASYEVLPSNVGKLNKTLTDLQYDHFLYEPMLHLAGNVDVFSFRN